MGSHSYLQNLQTNINSLQTAGLLNSHANRFTTTNVGHLVGGNTSVITLSELDFAIHFTDAQIAAAEAKAKHAAERKAASEVATETSAEPEAAAEAEAAAEEATEAAAEGNKAAVRIKSKYKGVYWKQSHKKWEARISVKGK